ncbi:hypothetical protein LTR37_010891 [Vermiconidia calcicola]|uniref:Uncharacterized protein n=1 Tax=Vermiconidia calcicola TaxID=1690605 RepID=A0ACC3N510_9PEZI|nr:hypothetical protein LTR37_010891 [Vermiconidia calcicola]
MPGRLRTILLSLSICVVARGAHADSPVSSLPPSAPYVYATPALYLNFIVKSVESLGKLSTGGTQLFAPIVEGYLRTEPDFEIQFSGAVRSAADYLTLDPDGITARGDVVGEVVPDSGDTPFLIRISGINHLSPQSAEIFTSNRTAGRAVPYGYSYSVWTPTFYGGSAKYAVLQNSIFVASETVSDSGRPGYFNVARFPILYRTYANDPSSEGATTAGNAGHATNIRETSAADPNSAQVNSARGKEGVAEDNAGASRSPVSQEMHAGQQDDPDPGYDNVKRPPEEPDHVKRQHVEKEGQKPLDPADKGSTAS